ncbi:S-adenosylmethionine:diacylglycerol 3-amino-3-carboxypropyl transferase-like protein [[Leptolyngbya] sp. PCC 7376]|uniref:DUF3419 family protein n=1 Tax=[Leptolyngbya] sp. PCC 7376 TaxID=111781 RepID=UPI00029ED11F|nr:DUF3419 family protein [[Leptolyngbya] sp. PCC 7376]AFY38426.1 S-adenosylmethionine:diacylglycerol 3-amino-3-carboxypropyl transferase-like protein [[Leptolyngbya] sp. PCC 7376]
MAAQVKSISSKQRRSPTTHPKKFSEIRYAQSWEDTDVMLAALDVQPFHTCLSIASGGDNTLALLSRQPKKVIAIDFSLAQIACLELRAAAYRNLSHPEMLLLVTSKTGVEPKLRLDLYYRCHADLSPAVKNFWGDRLSVIKNGLMSGGKFERYLTLFRQRVLPLIHSPKILDELFQQGDRQEREKWFEQNWNTWRWQWIFRIFFSRFVMGKLGRDPSFFKYVEGNVANSILERANFALVHHNPQKNSYLQWIATGDYQTALPYALRPENFNSIRNHLDSLEIHCLGLNSYLKKYPSQIVDRFNLSNIFEWISEEEYHLLLRKLIKSSQYNSRLMYWNLLVSRQRPEYFSKQIQPLSVLSEELYQSSQIFFYKTLVIEAINSV